MTKNASSGSPDPSRQRPKLLVYQKTHVGRVRDHNEDSSYSDPDSRFFIVADGMGGHAAGEVASQLAVEEVKTRLDSERAVIDSPGDEPGGLTRPGMTELLERVGSFANTAVRKRAREDPATHGMGTTLEVVVIAADGAWIAHVGDSRTYLVRHGFVSQLTTDHTVGQRLSDKQKKALGEAVEQWGDVLVEAVGAKDEVAVEVIHSELETGDRFLLCSDGLYEYFPRPTEIAEILALEGSKAGLERLVEVALERGGKDNITGLLVEVAEVTASRRAGLDAPDAGSEPGLAYDQTVEGAAPVRDAIDQGYGIEDAIALMRRLPAEKVELVVRVMKKTLESTDISIPAIIRDATEKQQRMDRRVGVLKEEIEASEREVAQRIDEISRLQADLDETGMVRERLQLAQKPGKPGGAQ